MNTVLDASDVSDDLIDDLLRDDTHATSMVQRSPAVKSKTREDVAADFKELLDSSNTRSSFVESEAVRRRIEREQRESALAQREIDLLAAVQEEESTYATELRTLDEELARQREAERLERQTILQLAANEAQSELQRKVVMIVIFIIGALFVMFRSTSIGGSSDTSMASIENVTKQS